MATTAVTYKRQTTKRALNAQWPRVGISRRRRLVLAAILPAVLWPAGPFAQPQGNDIPTLYIGGKPIAPPYSVRVIDEKIMINGFQFAPPVERPRQRRHVVTPSPLQSRQYAIMQEARRIWLDTVTGPGDSLVIRAGQLVSAYYEQQVEIRSVEHSPGSCTIVVNWSSTGPTHNSYPDWAYLQQVPTPEEQQHALHEHAETLQRLLDSGTVIVQSGGMKLQFSRYARKDLLEEINLARSGRWQSGSLTEKLVESLGDPIPLSLLKTGGE